MRLRQLHKFDGAKLPKANLRQHHFAPTPKGDVRSRSITPFGDGAKLAQRRSLAAPEGMKKCQQSRSSLGTIWKPFAASCRTTCTRTG
jgi:hypothetical protein